MTTRIRYRKLAGTQKEYESIKHYKSETTGAVYEVFFNLENHTFRIRNINSGTVVVGGDNVNNTAVLKRNIKRKMKSLGISFALDLRNVKKVEKKDCDNVENVL